MAMSQRRLLAYPKAAYHRPVMPAYRTRRVQTALSWLYWVAFWMALLVLATLWGHRPRPVTTDTTSMFSTADYAVFTP